MNIREQILISRVKHFVDDSTNALDIGVGYLERYFSLIAFCAFLHERFSTDTASSSVVCPNFAQWMQRNRDIWNKLNVFRKQAQKLPFFRPIEDLAALSSKRHELRVEPISPTGAAIVEKYLPEYQVIKSRSGSVLGAHTILKIDHWGKPRIRSLITGAPNFYQVPETKVYAVAQPTLPALRSIVAMIRHTLSPEEKIVWINVREEPVIYITTEPYVLRDQYATLRNIKSFAGIAVTRLEDMEARLKDDVLTESHLYNNKVLVHSESATSGALYPSWLTLDQPDEVLTLKDIFEKSIEEFSELEYIRLPITAEEALEPHHFDQIRTLILEHPIDKLHLIFNCQMGASRSTSCAIAARMVEKWRKEGLTLRNLRISRSSTPHSLAERELNYRLIHSILRVIGSECKYIVDGIIAEISAVVNLREAIEVNRRAAETAADPNEVRRAVRKGVIALKRYALLILFQGYLNAYLPPTEDSTELIAIESFSEWLERHQEFKVLLDELNRKNSLDLLGEEMLLAPDQGPAPISEVKDVVQHRYGQVLAPMTILKFDHFPGCQKTSLAERIDGAPNFRLVSLDGQYKVYGLAMPTKYGFVNVLKRIKQSVIWICLREEPVIYLRGRPYVLRIVKDPVVNVEMTGIITERVESMERKLKADVLRELAKNKGKIMLHEEDSVTKQIMPIWEALDPEDVQTTAEVAKCLASIDGKPSIKYYRIPITDEQAPIPSVFDQVLSLVWQGTDLPVFNCQMGRGRTTTGMVIATLLYLVRNRTILSEIMETDLFSPTTEEDISTLGDSDQTRVRLLAGEYKSISSLIQVLEHGKEAKRILDISIDHCAEIQNLRTAIYDYYTQKDGKERGLNYLLRYFFLVAFSAYLLEINCHEDQAGQTFVCWLSERKEITNMIARRESIEFS